MKIVLKVILIILLVLVLVAAGGFAYLYSNGISGMSNTTEAEEGQIKIACVGDSTTYFVIISNLFMALKFFMPTKPKKENLTAAEERKAKAKTGIALVLGFLIGIECGFMGSAGGALMLMVLTMVLGMDTKLAVGTSSMVMTLVALTGAVSHLAMGATVDLIPSIVVTVMCTIGAVGSARFANRVEEKLLNRVAGIVLILVSAVSWILSA